MIDTTETRAAIDALLLRHGVSMTAVFVPQSASRNSEDKGRSLNWRLTFKLASNKASFALDYTQGIGHVPGYRAPKTVYDCKLMGEPWETGTYRDAGKLRKLPAPYAADLLHSIVLDAQCIDNTFEEFCGECGYDTDSRKAEATYDACRRQSRDVQRVLGAALLKEAAELLQDY